MKTLTQPKLHNNTVFDLIAKGTRCLEERGFETPRYEAEEILFTLLKTTRIGLYLNADCQISDADQETFLNQIVRRGAYEPLQYITGQVDFCGLTLSVAPDVFIPRPETEMIVEQASAMTFIPMTILDVCTGSGALAIALAKKFPSASMTAIDCSDIALDIAMLNAQKHETAIAFLQGDLFAPLMPKQDQFDLIVCNPPYIAKDDQQIGQDVLLHEPALALFSEDSGLAHIKRVLTDAPLFLAPHGTLMLEIGIGQSIALIDFIKNNIPFDVNVIQDIAGIDRILICRWTK